MMTRGDKTTVEELAEAAREELGDFIANRSDTMMVAISNIAGALAQQRNMEFPKEPEGLEGEAYSTWLDENWTDEVSDRWQLLEWEAFRYIVEPLIRTELSGDTEIVIGS